MIAYAKAHPNPEERERSVWEGFEAERAALVPYAGRFDGFHAVPAAVSSTCLVRFDNNKYSVAASAIGRPVEVRAYAERVEIHRRGPCRSFEAVKFATLEWVDWFNTRRLLEPIGNVPPAEAEARYFAQTEGEALAA